jgi:hypothetical protein
MVNEEKIAERIAGGKTVTLSESDTSLQMAAKVGELATIVNRRIRQLDSELRRDSREMWERSDSEQDLANGQMREHEDLTAKFTAMVKASKILQRA